MPFLLLGGIGLSLFFIQAAARFGMSRMFSQYALITNDISAANEAVRFTPSDPEAHRARATVLNREQMSTDAAKSLETAARLRYRDDYLWIELGNTREELGDTEGALVALDEAVRWAPYYAHTHWHRGNLLLRMGRSADAFAELRRAVAANPGYTLNLIDLAWVISGDNLKTTEALLDIKDDSARLALIRFLARRGKGMEVIDEIRLLTTLSVEDKAELARLLFGSKAFYEASKLSSAPEVAILNGGFEEPLVLNETGFGWLIANDQKSHLAVDVSEKLSGAKSLQINLDGDWNPGTSLLSQTFIVESGKTYRVSFGVKTKDLVTGGPPVVTITDAINDQLLAKSANFPTGTTSWVKLNLEFTALPTSQAAVIRLQRNNCDSSPCPIFGNLWLDEFYIEQTPATKTSKLAK